MIGVLSDENLSYLVDFIQRFMLPEKTEETTCNPDQKMTAFYEMEKLKSKTNLYFSDNFDPDKEYQTAMEEKYGTFN